MRALVYVGAGRKALEERPKPQLQQPTDAIVRMTKTTICGTDLHILRGDLASCQPGRVLGHEGIGVIESVGAAVTALAVGDRVLVSCITACGACAYCRRLMYSHCTSGGWILGNTIDGTQADFVRIPHASTSLRPLPADADEEAMVMLSDILPTGFECGVLNGRIAPGGIVAIVGAGPIGLAAMLTARFYSPATVIMIDPDEHRLELAKRLGATVVVGGGAKVAIEVIMKLTENRGVDTAIEAVGSAATFELCEQLLAPGGTLANVGVHGSPVTLHKERLWDRNVTITTRLVDTVSTQMLLDMVASHQLDPRVLITHRFGMSAMLEAYDTFANARQTKALKVIVAA